MPYVFSLPGDFAKPSSDVGAHPHYEQDSNQGENEGTLQLKIDIENAEEQAAGQNGFAEKNQVPARPPFYFGLIVGQASGLPFGRRFGEECTIKRSH